MVASSAVSGNRCVRESEDPWRALCIKAHGSLGLLVTNHRAMELLLLFVLAVLIYIAYQFSKYRTDLKSEREKDREDERINEMMPHLYKKSSTDDLKKDIKRYLVDAADFFRSADRVHERTAEESNPERKQKMEAVLEKLGPAVVEAKKLLDKTEATDNEKMYLLWAKFGPVYENFPEIEITESGFEDFLMLTGLDGMISAKAR